MAKDNVTSMFAEIVGLAELARHVSAAEADHAAERCRKRIERAIAGHGGQITESAGGRLLARFESAAAATQAATEVEERVAALPPVSGTKLTVRTGIEGGENAKTTAVAARTAPAAKVAAPAAAPAPAGNTGGHLCVRYRGQAFLLDDKTPFLTLGRDADNLLVIVDRKASRAHGRIEKQTDRYVFIDSSTNGTYIAVGDQPEVMVRRRTLELAGDGRMYFGASGSDPNADFAEYEHL